MKKLILLFTLVATPAYANFACGIPPLATFGCKNICICDDGECRFIQICE